MSLKHGLTLGYTEIIEIKKSPYDDLSAELQKRMKFDWVFIIEGAGGYAQVVSLQGERSNFTTTFQSPEEVDLDKIVGMLLLTGDYDTDRERFKYGGLP